MKEEGVDAWVQLCAFYVGKEEYAVDILRVEEILHPLPVTAVPHAPAFVEGVVNLRGLIIPVVDLRKRLGAGPPPPRIKPKMMVSLVGGRRVALLVDGVSEVIRLRKSELKPSPTMSLGAAAPYVIGVCGPANRLKLLLNLKAVLQADSPGAPGRAGAGAG